MLQLMRLSWLKRFRHRFMRLVPNRVRERMLRQDAFARRHGLAVLRVAILILLGSVLLTSAYFAALWLQESGILSPPAAG